MTEVDQQMFCCAVAYGRGPKVTWLHKTCHDYWERLQAAEAEVDRLRAEIRQYRGDFITTQAEIERLQAAIEAARGGEVDALVQCGRAFLWDSDQIGSTCELRRGHEGPHGFAP